MKYCPHCGAVLPDGAFSFCPACGKPLPETAAPATEKEHPEKKKKTKPAKPRERKKSAKPSPSLPDDSYDGYYDDLIPIDAGKRRGGGGGHRHHQKSDCRGGLPAGGDRGLRGAAVYSVGAVMERFKNLPQPLQKLVAGRLLFGCVLLALGFICRIFLQNWLLCLPGFVAGGFLVFSGGKLFLRLTSGDYLCLRGVCLEIEKLKLGGQIRRMVIDIEGKRVQLTVGKNHKHLAVGDTVTLYLLPDTLVYEQDGLCRVYNWLALERAPLAEKD